jgi:hypothetical protein
MSKAKVLWCHSDGCQHPQIIRIFLEKDFECAEEKLKMMQETKTDSWFLTDQEVN